MAKISPIVKSKKSGPQIPLTTERAAELLRKFAALAVKNKAYALDTETDGLRWHKNSVLMVSLYTPSMELVIPLNWESSIAATDLADILKPVTDKKIVCYMHNAKFDRHFLQNMNVKIDNEIVDVLMLARMTNNTIPADLKSRARLDAGMDLVEFKKLFDLTRGKTLLDYPLEDVGRYAGKDAVATYKLGNKYSNGGFLDNPSFSVGEDPELTTLYRKIEHKMTDVLYRMERRGILLNVEKVTAHKAELAPKIKALEERAVALNKYPINIKSPKQLKEALARKGIKTDCTDVDALNAIFRKTQDPLVGVVLEHRGLVKLMGTYIDGMLAIRDSGDIIHTSFNQGGTDTGRLSSSEPNMQNIPRDGAIRDFFRPRPGYCFVVYDFGQLELRVAAHASGDEVMIEEFKKGLDIHRVSAAAIFKKSPEEVTDEERQKGKSTTSFGVLFGMGAWNLALELGVTEDQAEMFIANYFRKYRKVDRFFKRVKQSAMQTGYVRTFLGRVRFLPDVRSEDRKKVSAAMRQAGNCVIQGAAADLVKLAMLNCDVPEVHATGARLLLQVHDELVFEVPVRNAYKASKLIEHRMVNFPVAAKLLVPLTIDGGIGYTWNDAKKGKLNKAFKEKYGKSDS